MSLVLFDEARQEDVEAVDDPEEVHAQYPLPGLQGLLDDEASRRHAGIQADHVGSSEGLLHRRPEVPDRAMVGHVAAHAEYFGACRLELGDRLVEHRLLDVGDRYAHALGCEAVGECPAHPRCATGDDGDLPVQFLHGLSLLIGLQSSSNACSSTSGIAGWI